MELSMDLTSVQGIFMGLERTPGELSEIVHKGGNEEKIEEVCDSLRKLLTSRGYLIGDAVDSMYTKEVTDILLFMAVNTKFKVALNIKEYEHLVNIMPMLSKCLLLNIVIDLNLSECYGNVLQIMPLHMGEELLHEAMYALLRAPPEKSLHNSLIFIKAIIAKLSNVEPTTCQIRQDVDSLSSVADNLLLWISVIQQDDIQNWSKNKLYTFIGRQMLELMNLLMMCNIEKDVLENVIKSLINALIKVAKVVTIDVYVQWAEIEHEDGSLQITIAWESYNVMQKYMKYKPAKELVQILSTSARKPPSLHESIRASTIEKKISKINADNSDQRQWFSSLLTTQVFDREDATSCLNKWSKLCTADDVTIVLKSAMKNKTRAAKKLALKCAAQLSVEDLTMVLCRYFSAYGLQNELEHENIQQELTSRLNRINQTKERNLSLDELESSSIREIELLLLQNPHEVVRILFSECVKNTVYTFWLRHAFIVLKLVLEIDMLGMRTLEGLLTNGDLTEQNVPALAHLIKTLTETGCCDSQQLLTKVLMPMFEEALDNEAKLRMVLTTIREIKFEDLNVATIDDLCVALLDILEKYRCKYTNFLRSNMEMTIIVTSVLQKLRHELDDGKIQEGISDINKFHVKPNSSFLDTVLPQYSLHNYGEAISRLIPVLSVCVPDEWSSIANELCLRNGASKTVEAITDFFLIVCQVTKTQDHEENPTVFHALSFYLQCYGICIKNLQVKEDCLDLEIEIIKNICRLLRELPSITRQSNGVNLISLFSERGLGRLKNDRNFVCSLVKLEDKQLTKIIAAKMLEQ